MVIVIEIASVSYFSVLSILLFARSLTFHEKKIEDIKAYEIKVDYFLQSLSVSSVLINLF